MARQLPGKSRAKRMLSMVDDGLKLPCHGNYEKTKDVIISRSVEDENLVRTNTPTLQCLSPNFDLETHLMQSPSTISYESSIFDNVDFVASPTLVFSTPRQRKRRFKENVVTRSIEYYNVCESTDLTTLSDTKVVKQGAETCDQTTSQEEYVQYTTLDSVPQDLLLGQNVLYTTPVDNDLTDISILQCEKTYVESDGYNNILTLNADFLVENQSTTTENVDVEPNDCNNAIVLNPDFAVENQCTTTENVDVESNDCNNAIVLNPDFAVENQCTTTENVDVESNDCNQSTTTQNVDIESSVCNQTTTTENDPSECNKSSTTKELTRKKRQNIKDWARVKNKNQKNSGQAYTSSRSKKIREQQYFFDLKEIMDKRYWLRADESNEKIMWTKIHEVKVTEANPDVNFFKYNYDDEYISLNTVPIIRSSRGRPKKAAVIDDSDELRNLYREPIALPKPLYDDLMSLCRTEAIPKHYHTFYNNLHCIGNSEEDTDIESED